MPGKFYWTNESFKTIFVSVKSTFSYGSFLVGPILRSKIGLALGPYHIYSSAKMWVSFSFTLITRCFAVECKVKPVLTYFRNPILASRSVENLLKVSQVLGDWRFNMILWSLYFKAETWIFEWMSWWKESGVNVVSYR